MFWVAYGVVVKDKEGKQGTKARQAAFRVLVASEIEGDPGSIPGGGVTKPAREHLLSSIVCGGSK